MAHELVGLEVLLMVEEDVVHRPERSLAGRGLGGLGGELCLGVDVAQRQVPPHVVHVPELCEERAHRGLGLAAVGALEVAVLHDGDGRLRRPADVVALRVDRFGEVDERLGVTEESADAAARGQTTRRGEDGPGEQGGDGGRDQDAEARLGELSPRKAIAAISRLSVNPTPETVPAPSTAAQPTDGRR